MNQVYIRDNKFSQHIVYSAKLLKPLGLQQRLGRANTRVPTPPRSTRIQVFLFATQRAIQPGVYLADGSLVKYQQQLKPHWKIITSPRHCRDAYATQGQE